MKRILIANDMLKGGGVENFLENLVRYLLNHDYDVSLYIPDCKQEDAEDVFGKDIKVFPHVRTLKYIRQFSLSWFWDRGKYVVENEMIHWKLFRENFDVVIALKEGPTMKEMSHIRAGSKYAWIHTDYRYMHWSKWNFRSKKCERKCMAKYDRVICVSDATKDSVIEAIGDSGNLCVKYNPIDCQKILTLSKNAIIESNDRNEVRFISVGRLVDQKNQKLLLEVCEALNKKYRFELWIIGDGQDRKMLQEMIKKKNLYNVQMFGTQNNPYPYIKDSDVFVSTSIWESYGLSVQEALTLGIPVITTECPTMREVFDTRFGMLVDNSFQSVYEAMEKMITDSKLRDIYRENIEKFFDRESLYEDRLKSICALWEGKDE